MKRLFTLLLSLAALNAVKAQVDTVGIDSIQYVSPGDLAACVDASPYVGKNVFTSGVVFVDGKEYGSTSHRTYICQTARFTPYGCLMVYASSSLNYAEKTCDLYEGDSVTLVGSINEYQGQTQFTPSALNDAIVVYKSGIKVYPQIITAGELNDNQQNNNLVDGEKYETGLVQIPNMEVVSVDPFGAGRVSFVVVDQAGNKVNISDNFWIQKTNAYSSGSCTGTKNGTFTPPVVGDKLDTITGIVLHSKNNCTGATGRGFEIHPYKTSHYKWGPAAPRISNFQRNYIVPKDNQAVVVSADIIDLGGSISAAQIFYTTGTDVFSSFSALTMTASGNTYSATIPAQSEGTFVRYYIRAEDNDGNITQLPNPDPTKETKAYRVRNNGLRIFDLQYTPFSLGNSIYKDMEITVQGVVTASGDMCDLPILHVQDEGSNSGWAGIEVIQPGQSYARGTLIEITGSVRENFGLTRIQTINISVKGTDKEVAPVYVAPDSLTTYGFARNERYEGMLVGLVRQGGGKLHVVDTNADGVSGSFAEWRVGTDALDPANGCRVLTGRENISSVYSSYVNSSFRVLDSLPVERVTVTDTLKMDTLLGILYYSFSNMKLLPRNNKDFRGVNAVPSTQEPCASDDPRIFVPKLPETMNADFLVFPNPARNVLQLRNFSKNEFIHATLYDLNGKPVAGRNTRLREDIIHIAHLNRGTYLLEISTPMGDVLDYRKIVIE